MSTVNNYFLNRSRNRAIDICIYSYYTYVLHIRVRKKVVSKKKKKKPFPRETFEAIRFRPMSIFNNIKKSVSNSYAYVYLYVVQVCNNGTGKRKKNPNSRILVWPPIFMPQAAALFSSAYNVYLSSRFLRTKSCIPKHRPPRPY